MDDNNNKNLTRVKIFTSFGEKYIIYFSSKEEVYAFMKNITGIEWVVIYPLFHQGEVQIHPKAIVAFEIIEEKIKKEGE